MRTLRWVPFAGVVFSLSCTVDVTTSALCKQCDEQSHPCPSPYQCVNNQCVGEGQTCTDGGVGGGAQGGGSGGGTTTGGGTATGGGTGTGGGGGGQAVCPNCTGCCNNGRCEFGIDDNLCGLGGAPCQACASDAGSHCSSQVCTGCTPQNCAGCCKDGVCQTPNTDLCGVNGAMCAACGSTADHCVLMSGPTAGTCACGNNDACGPGTVCSGGMCVCDASSGCAGCCLKGAGAGGGDLCLPVTAQTNACGVNGATCATCAAPNVCSAGVCGCGGSAACGNGTECVQGACHCTANSCSGCCQNDVCMPGDAGSACGVGGQQCGNCGASQCVAGQCSSCAGCNGCCSNGTCVTATSQTQCGSNGQTCVGCGLSGDSCAGGSCHCGDGGACGNGKECKNGLCVCDSTSCPNGCCSGGGTCYTPTTVSHCGLDGGSCNQNCSFSRADSCSKQGTCSCAGNVDGGFAQCPTGTRCTSSGCVCDANSNCNGCCSLNVCYTGNTTSQCGANGAGCQLCSPPDTCQSGTCGSCSTATCPGDGGFLGCCQSGSCQLGTTNAACGTGGGSCHYCGSKSSGCDAGVCTCGANPQCLDGNRCTNATCVCDPTQCNGGCPSDGGICLTGN